MVARNGALSFPVLLSQTEVFAARGERRKRRQDGGRIVQATLMYLLRSRARIVRVAVALAVVFYKRTPGEFPAGRRDALSRMSLILLGTAHLFGV